MKLFLTRLLRFLRIMSFGFNLLKIILPKNAQIERFKYEINGNENTS